LATKTADLAAFAASLRFEQLPDEVVHQAERLILDTCGCTVAAYVLDGAKKLSRTIQALGGVPEATMIGTAYRGPAPLVSLVNAQLANALDLDDNLLYCSHIANAATMPTLAVAERTHASGKRLVTAVVAAYEVAARVMLSLTNIMTAIEPAPSARFRWTAPAGHSYNVFAAVSGAGRVLGLDPSRMAEAFGIAGYTTVPQTHAKASAAERLTDLKLGAYGWMAWSGTLAALLAEEGMTGDSSVLDGPKGFWSIAGYAGCDFDLLTRDLGSKWWILDTSFKPYPAGTWMRTAATALDEIVTRTGLRAEEVEKIVVRTMILRNDAERNVFTQDVPQSARDTQVSYPYLIAMRALAISPQRWHRPETYLDPRVRRLTEAVELVQDQDTLDAVYRETLTWHGRTRKVPATVEVHARGTVFEAHAEYARGDPFDPQMRLSDDELRGKFLRHAGEVISGERLEQAAELLLQVARVDDVAAVVSRLTPSEASGAAVRVRP
jgi:2-methylcitrate dehydratase PrpD